MSQEFMAMHKRVADAIRGSGHKAVVEYSAYPIGADGLPVDNLDDVAVEGDVLLYAKVDPFWSRPLAHHYASGVLHNPTWLDVAVAANAMILATGDTHHVYLEGIERTAYNVSATVAVYTFVMGS